jgi:hypothetical protein
MEKRKFLYAFIETENSHLSNYLSENGKVEGMVLSYDFEVTKDRDKICIKEILPDSIKIRDHSKSMMDVGVRHVRGSQRCDGGKSHCATLRATHERYPPGYGSGVSCSAGTMMEICPAARTT